MSNTINKLERTQVGELVDEQMLDRELKRLAAAGRMYIENGERIHVRTLWVYKSGVSGRACRYVTYLSGTTLRLIHKTKSWSNKKNKHGRYVWYNPGLEKLAKQIESQMHAEHIMHDAQRREAEAEAKAD